MKLFALLSTFFVACTALKSPVLSVPRGGATSIGPLDGAMAMKLAKTATGAYVAGSASKLVNKHTGGNDSVLADFVTGDLFQLYSLITVCACSLYNLGGSSFDALKTIAGGSILALALVLKNDGVSADTIKKNAVQSVLTVVLAILAFVD